MASTSVLYETLFPHTPQQNIYSYIIFLLLEDIKSPLCIILMPFVLSQTRFQLDVSLSYTLTILTFDFYLFFPFACFCFVN